MERIYSHYKKRISLEEIGLLYRIHADEYPKLVELIDELLKKSYIKVIRTSGTNGKKPVLSNRYMIIRPEEDYKMYMEELKYNMSPDLDSSYYINNIERYIIDRDKILPLNEFYKNNKSALDTTISLNERSCQIWGFEKEITKKGAKEILRRVGLTIEDLNIYMTSEPLAYYSADETSPQNILVVENKDTFYSVRRYLLEKNNTIMGEKIGTVVYGAGKRIYGNFNDFFTCAPDYLADTRNKIFYVGDIDYEGIGIYESFRENFGDRCNISVAKKMYLRMLEKANRLPDSKEKQNKNISGAFFEEFSEEETKKIKEILESGKYIPQEILNITDF